MSIVESLFRRISKERVVHASGGYLGYRQLLEQLAAGIEPAADEARIILDELNKSPEQVAGDVEILRQRKRDQEMVAKRSQVDIDLAATESELSRIRQEWDASNRAFQHRYDLAKSRSGQLQGQVGAAVFAQSRLEGSCLNPALNEQERDLRATLARTAKAIREKKEYLKTIQIPEAVEFQQEQVDELQREYDQALADLQQNTRARIAD